MRRSIAVMALVLVWTLLGSGAAAHWHALQHDEAAPQSADCPLHAQLHTPVLSATADQAAQAIDVPLAFGHRLDAAPFRATPHISGNKVRGPPVC